MSKGCVPPTLKLQYSVFCEVGTVFFSDCWICSVKSQLQHMAQCYYFRLSQNQNWLKKLTNIISWGKQRLCAQGSQCEVACGPVSGDKSLFFLEQ
jgi:hypothetical protein